MRRTRAGKHSLQSAAAALTAAGWHATQRRKGSAGEPCINHLLKVAALVSRVTQGEDADLVVAALIHDAVEDQGISGQTIAAMFGENVAGLALEVTDNKSLPQEARKRAQVDQAPKKSQRAKILKLADKISNVTAIGRDPPPDWPIERQLGYVQRGRDVVAGIRGASLELERMFDEGADEATRLITSRRR